MAIRAGRVRWSEGAAYMATLASNARMRSVKDEASAEVIEHLLRPRAA